MVTAPIASIAIWLLTLPPSRPGRPISKDRYMDANLESRMNDNPAARTGWRAEYGAEVPRMFGAKRSPVAVCSTRSSAMSNKTAEMTRLMRATNPGWRGWIDKASARFWLALTSIRCRWPAIITAVNDDVVPGPRRSPAVPEATGQCQRAGRPVTPQREALAVAETPGRDSGRQGWERRAQANRR
ncbi:hypothetical protein SAMN05443248_8040 [Bradyrhizobium erythrophlei]|uniref:Uncharacterized protein n=1 Tax=Bradyrhizobium erythrophlei TaxID=1437360 RepID=A0A1M5Y8I6_9BRAD|nr:hypothetical protein SAMN05443248_8040 [Bradyrhizobium erythrophlei]